MKFKLVATVLAVSFLVLPMNVSAVIGGEDAATNGYVEYLEYDIDTGETTTYYTSIDNSTETWSLFTEREVSQMKTAISIQDNEISTSAIIGNLDYEETAPSSDPKNSAVVLLIMKWDEDGDGISDSTTRGTGFLVSHNVLVTNAHCVVHDKEYTLVEARVYYDVHGSSYNGCSYITLDKLLWSYGYTAEDKEVQARYDYCVATMNESLSRRFYFNCVNSESIEGLKVTLSGYPSSNGKEPTETGYVSFDYRQQSCDGYILHASEYHLYYDNDSTGGISGGPIYDDSGTAYGVHRGGYSSDANRAVRFHSQLYSTICDAVKRYS